MTVFLNGHGNVDEVEKSQCADSAITDAMYLPESPAGNQNWSMAQL
jgi:hypothetical protein